MPIRSLNLHFGYCYQFVYTNYKGSTKIRVVRFDDIQYGSNEYYPNDELFFHGYDYDKKAPRSFAFSKIDMSTFKRIQTPIEPYGI